MSVRIINGDCRTMLATLPDQSVQCCVTSPPYFGLRDYGIAEQIGLEPTPAEFVAELVAVFREVRRVLRDDGTLWLNLGDSYNSQPAGNKTPSGFSQTRPSRISGNGDQETVKTGRVLVPGLKIKDLIGIPWRVAFALQADGWYLRQDIIWSKPNPMPESVTDRCTKAHEYVFLLSKSPRYFCDMASIAEPAQDWSQGGPGVGIKETTHYGAGNGGNAGLKGIAQRYKDGDAPPTRNKRSVWSIATQSFADAHFATMAPELAETCIKAGCPVGGVVLDPFGGAGTTGLVADRLQRSAILVELNPAYADIADRRIRGDAPLFAEVEAA